MENGRIENLDSPVAVKSLKAGSTYRIDPGA